LANRPAGYPVVRPFVQQDRQPFGCPSGRLSGCFLVYPDSRFTASTAQRNIKIPVVYPFDYQCVVHCLSTRRFVASGHGVRTGKGLLLCRRKPK
ncbi:hypothetical protein K0H26_18665, partial [Bacteroides fragilis]|nr:hypothetical protein [Bacteroides fragilis]MCE9414268.1 hypothetical protein [Bacteroides fragilis]